MTLEHAKYVDIKRAKLCLGKAQERTDAHVLDMSPDTLSRKPWKTERLF